MKTLVIATSLLALASTATPAAAGNRSSFDLSSLLSGARVNWNYCHGFIEPAEADKAREALAHIEKTTTEARAIWGEMEARDRQDNGKLYRKIERLEAYQGKLAKHVERAASGQPSPFKTYEPDKDPEAHQRWEAFDDKYSKHARTFDRIVPVMCSRGEGYVGHGAKLPAIRDLLRDVKADCDGGLSDAAAPVGKTGWRHPALACQAAADAQELMLDYATFAAHKEMSRWVKRIDKVTRNLSDNQGFIHIDMPEMEAMAFFDLPGLKKKYLEPELGEWVQHIDAEMPDEVLQPITDAVQRFWDEMYRLRDKWTFPPADGKDKRVEKIAKKALLQEYPKAKVKKVLMSDNSWGEDSGRRGKSVAALFQLPGEDFCREGAFGYWEEHLGGGKYAKSNEVSFWGYRYLSCR